ncbi:MAG: MFS transporter [Candidatus Moranbacteria bacterium]|nr:MFS transporter [Candidatus Moranbacteria bacterium]
MQLFHFHHRQSIQRLIHSDFWLFEFSVWLHTFATSMVSIFVPIFLLQIGYGIGEVMIYYFLFNLFDTPLNFFARYLTRKIGAKWVVVWGSAFAVAFFVGLFALSAGNWPLLVLIALFAALYDTFYWVAHLYLFMKCSKNDEDVSKDAGTLRMVRRVAGMVAPALGAVVLISWGREALLLASALILAVSIVPLVKIKEIDDKPKRKQKSYKEFFSTWDVTRDYVASIFITFHNTTESILWPIFIYLLFVTVESVAVLPIIVSVTAVFFIYIASKTKKEKRNTIMAMASMAIAVVWISRLFVDNSYFYYISVFLIGFFTIFVALPLDSNIFEKGEKVDTLSASMYMNTSHMFANAILFGVLAVLVNVFHTSFILAALSMFVVAALSYFVGKGMTGRK